MDDIVIDFNSEAERRVLPINSIICGDNVETMATFPADCIDLTVTSPPYGELRTYGGHSWDFEGVAQQLWRITKPGGVVVWIVNDQTINGSESGESFRQALRFKEIGFRLHDTMIWEKVDASPGDGKYRYHDAFEYMFILSKGVPSTRNLIRDVPATNAGAVDKNNFDRRRDQSKKGKARTPWIRPEFGFRRNVWKTKHGADSEAIAMNHPAIFPPSLARDHILSWSNAGYIVLDPFAGSGTTPRKAKDLGRKWIGIEINPEYIEIIKTRMAQQVIEFPVDELETDSIE